MKENISQNEPIVYLLKEEPGIVMSVKLIKYKEEKL